MAAPGPPPGGDISEGEVIVDGCNVRYLKAGSGPALLLVHGLLGYSFSWRFNLGALSAHRTVYALDLPGIGYSGRCPTLDFGLRASASRLLRIADCLGLPEFELVGSSHGGALSTMAASLAHKRVRKLVLVSPANPWSRYGRRRIRLFGTAAGALVLRCASPMMPLFNHLGVERMYGDPRRIAPGTLEGYSAPLRIPGTTAYVLAILRTWERDLSDMASALAALSSMPALVMWGDIDRAVDPQSAQELIARMPHAELTTFSGVGHLPYEEVPDAFNEAVLNFLMDD